MSQALLQHVEQKSNSLKKAVPPVRVGDRVKVHQRIVETTKDGTKERIQLFEGLVIKVGSGAGVNKTMTVRKIASGVGVEKVFPIHSKNVAQIEILAHSKIRRSKLYFMRERTGKRARLKEGKMLDFEMPVEAGEEVSAEAIEEAVEHAAEEEAKAEEATPETAEAPAEEAKAEEATPEAPADEAPAEEDASEDAGEKAE
jgi:large subunit ribosomal protein L19